LAIEKQEALSYFKGLSLDGGRADFSKKAAATLPLIKIYRLSLISTRSISLDGTFKGLCLVSFLKRFNFFNGLYLTFSMVYRFIGPDARGKIWFQQEAIT
jgi:hypothetical protein